jgi:hypothetical protein
VLRWWLEDCGAMGAEREGWVYLFQSVEFFSVEFVKFGVDV